MIKKAKNLLIDYIKKYGSIDGEIINVEHFLNHKVDPHLLNIITHAFAEFLQPYEFDKIITVESSGIVLATALSINLNKPFIFIKKTKPITMKEYEEAESYSFTKKNSTNLFISKKCIERGEKAIIVDDFYANGNTHKAIISLSEKIGFQIIKYLVVINKSDNNEIFSILNRKEIKEINYAT